MSPVRESRLLAGRKAIAAIRRYRSTLTRERLLIDEDAERMVLHAVLIAIQASVDEALAACRRRQLTAETYRAAFEELGRAGAIPADWVPDLMGWASLRNLVAHFYPVIDIGRVFDALTEVEVLERFLDWCERDAI